MSHIHDIKDLDKYFFIDPVTKLIETDSEKLVVAQFDHNSERFTFGIPQMVEGHDMEQCSRVEIHFNNYIRTKKEINSDVYYAEDLEANRGVVYFSWPIRREATQLVGTLDFSITFVCTDEDGNEDYSWSTQVFDGISVVARNNNTQTVIEAYPDLYEKMKREIVEEVSGEIDCSGGTVKSVNGKSPDEAGNVEIDIPCSGGTVKSINGLNPNEEGNVDITIPDDEHIRSIVDEMLGEIVNDEY